MPRSAYNDVTGLCHSTGCPELYFPSGSTADRDSAGDGECRGGGLLEREWREFPS